MSGKIPVIEIFDRPTIQGEGPVIGVKTMFVRTAGCDFFCDWCDSRYTWDGSQKAIMMTPHAVLEEVIRKGGDNFNHITISGGNPLLIGDPMDEFVDSAHDAGYVLSVETQGTKYQPWLRKIDQVVISPKPPSSKMDTDFTLLRQNIDLIGRESYRDIALKVVVFDDADYEYASYVHRLFPNVSFYLQVGNPEVGTEIDPVDHLRLLIDRLDWLWGKAIPDPVMNDARVLPQLHTLVWSNKRGV